MDQAKKYNAKLHIFNVPLPLDPCGNSNVAKAADPDHLNGSADTDDDLVQQTIGALKLKYKDLFDEAIQDFEFVVKVGTPDVEVINDLKNMLEGLEGGAYVIDEGSKDGDLELTGKGWHIVKKNVSEISRVTQNLLYSAKKREPELQQMKPTDAARRAVELFQEKANVLEIQLNSQLNPALPQTTMDSPSIVRMLSNLIWNALEACDKNKQKASSSVIVRADFYNKNHYMLEVEDNANGMDETTQENLFKEFFSTKGDTGTGLGLLVVDRIVRNHGGKIEILTKPGIGSLFRTIFRIH